MREINWTQLRQEHARQKELAAKRERMFHDLVRVLQDADDAGLFDMATSAAIGAKHVYRKDCKAVLKRALELS